MKTIIFAAILFFAVMPKGQAQLQDNFSDGDLTTGTIWLGGGANFIVNAAKELALNAPAPLPTGSSDTSQIYTFLTFPDSTIWDFYFRLGFSPSTSNQLRVYLQADQATLTNANGYYVEVGETNADTLKLFRQNANGTVVKLAASTQGFTTALKAKVRITRSSSGNWKIFSDYDGGNNLIEEVSFIDNVYRGADASVFGFWCKYTSGNKDKFFFDDINIQPLLPDTQAPFFASLNVINANSIDVTFDEKVDISFASNESNFGVNKGIGAPSSAVLDATNKNLVHLVFANSLQTNVYTLVVKNATDLLGNIGLVPQARSFSYINFEIAARYDISISEIMADPTPTIGTLPPVEYIELYNRSNKTINLQGFELSNGNVTKTVLPYYDLKPFQYLVVYEKASGVSFFNKDTLSVNSLISFSNEGDDITLLDVNGAIIDGVTYDISWYKNSEKSDGGWSLERINIASPCDNNSTNWAASVSLNGGTPGVVNSVAQIQMDTTMPKLLTVFPNSRTEIIANFSKSLNEIDVTNIAKYSISNNIIIQAASLQGANNQQVKLILQTPLQENIFYTFTAKAGLKDCVGNIIFQDATLRLALPQIAQAKDLVINELLFNAPTGGVDFVELYNRSNKVIDIGTLSIGSFADGNQSVRELTTHYLLFPDEYVAITPKIVTTLNSFFALSPAAFLENSLPTLDDKKGNVTLFKSNFFSIDIIDSLNYDENWHNALLKDKNGVSLERVNPSLPTNDRNNWQSAATAVGYATPTYKNSQYLAASNSTENNIFSMSKEVFSPDGDGYEDFLSLDYQTDNSGYLATVRIYDSRGNLVKNLVKNELLATQGNLRWDGETDDGAKTRIGIYIIYAQITSASGTVKEQKMTCVVAIKF